MLGNILIDTNALVALFDRDDTHHAKTVEFIQTCKMRLYTNHAVITETAFMLSFNVTIKLAFLRWLQNGAVHIENILNEDLERIIVLIQKYADLPMDFADATLVAQAERLTIRDIATYDRDFEIYRIHGRQTFRNVLSD